MKILSILLCLFVMGCGEKVKEIPVRFAEPEKDKCSYFDAKDSKYVRLPCEDWNYLWKKHPSRNTEEVLRKCPPCYRHSINLIRNENGRFQAHYGYAIPRDFVFPEEEE